MSHTLPLHELHRDLGAAFGERQGWTVPVHYGDPEAEYRAVRETAGLLDRSHTGKVEVFGRDRVSFLQGMFTNDLKLLSPGEGCAAAILDNHGKVQALLNAYALEDRLLLSFPPGLVEKALALLDKFLISERVEFRDVTEAIGCLAVEGGGSARIVSELTGKALTLPLGRHVERVVAGVPVRLFGHSETGEPGFHLWAPREHLSELWKKLSDAGAPSVRPVGEKALNVLRVEAGLPWYPEDVNEGLLFMEAESTLPSLVSFTKGCYIGQEVVARVKYRGHVNRRLTGLIILDGVEPVSEAKVIAEGKEVGWITSSVFSPAVKRPIALGIVRREVEVGAEVNLESGSVRLKARLSALPFYRPEKTEGGPA